jgi:hypothetical protein
MSLNEEPSVTDLIKCVKCEKEGLKLCQICGGIFCDGHSAFLRTDDPEDFVDQKCLYCYEASLKDSSLY